MVNGNVQFLYTSHDLVKQISEDLVHWLPCSNFSTRVNASKFSSNVTNSSTINMVHMSHNLFMDNGHISKMYCL